jgi:hypothetical protein
MNKKFSKAWIDAVNKVSAKLDLLHDLQNEARYQLEKMHTREAENPPGRLLKHLTDIDIQDFDEKIQASAAELEEKFHPVTDKKGKKKK